MQKNKRKLLVFGLLAASLLLAALFADRLCPFDPYKQDLTLSYLKPCKEHLLGCDRYGRDLLSRIIMGSRASIYFAWILVAIITVIGTMIGIAAGWYGGKIEAVVMPICDVFLAFPGLVFALAVAGVLGGGLGNAVIALACIGWPKYARLAREEVLVQKNAAYIKASKMAGCTDALILGKHVLPNIAGPILVTASLDIGTMMMELAGLSYLGLGALPPNAEWGSMMSDGRSMIQTVPWVILGPGAAIFITVIVFQLFGDALRDHLNPKKR